MIPTAAQASASVNKLVGKAQTLYNNAKKGMSGEVGGKGPGDSKRVFGTSLMDAVSSSATTPKCGGHPIPTFIENALVCIENNFTSVEGIFRLSGQASVITSLKDRIDRGEDCDFSDVTDSHAIAGVVKSYLREMSDPLLTFDLFDAFTAANGNADEASRRSHLKACIRALPAANYSLLRRLCLFFKQLSSIPSTKMTPQNFGTVIGPNIMKSRGESALQMVAGTTTVLGVSMELIVNADDYFSPAKAETSFTGIARAQFDYAPTSGQELSLTANGIVFVTDSKREDGWWEGEVPSGTGTGIFPANYVTMIAEIMEIFPFNSSTPSAPSSARGSISSISGPGAALGAAIQMSFNKNNNPPGAAGSGMLGGAKKDDLLSLHSQLKQQAQERKELEETVVALATDYQTLKDRLDELERENAALNDEVARLRTVAGVGGGSSSKPGSANGRVPPADLPAPISITKKPVVPAPIASPGPAARPVPGLKSVGSDPAMGAAPKPIAPAAKPAFKPNLTAATANLPPPMASPQPLATPPPLANSRGSQKPAPVAAAAPAAAAEPAEIKSPIVANLDDMFADLEREFADL